jgi:hypothetical protein
MSRRPLFIYLDSISKAPQQAQYERMVWEDTNDTLSTSNLLIEPLDTIDCPESPVVAKESGHATVLLKEPVQKRVI